MTRRQLLGATAGAAVAGLGGWVFAGPNVQVYKIVARRFEFLPHVVRLTKGIPALLEFTSEDVIMGFNCPAFDVRTDIVPGQVARVRFTPDKVGTFDFLCDIFCGDGHENMTGKITVVA